MSSENCIKTKYIVKTNLLRSLKIVFIPGLCNEMYQISTKQIFKNSKEKDVHAQQNGRRSTIVYRTNADV